VKAVATSSTTIRLSWDPVPGALAYGVMYEGDFLGATDETVAEFEELLPNTTYCFKVFTITEVDAEGTITGYSEDYYKVEKPYVGVNTFLREYKRTTVGHEGHPLFPVFDIDNYIANMSKKWRS
jgi:hypothetical protein